ncbi:hypothetical protein PTSG_03371 [Salpingoeca rosetta]|uniref:AB hydrolase-1 domain-containing protein n=1 Tax=Salpingoeca rosetta (strain ATCC 50818 / BSB-021) TaxID=946362 RepID=F2U504_SALR5|nr:uncharacterized protein PTSG_03371 [Salpingoeca rosetta]EGD82720.1 hypothetical protein PTSG_03371 [Salpingoeca rosetta]|eukprot:XP_004995956.1 hypothetical protein PTSG_03371 [Salpingoeca rosetta]
MSGSAAADVVVEVLRAGPARKDKSCKGVIVFLHGWPDTNALWKNQVDFFTKHKYHCACLSLPSYSGYDSSHKWALDFPDVRDVLIRQIKEVNDGKPVHVVAHDWGAVFAYMIERKAPELVKTLSTIDVGGRIHIASVAGKVLVPAYQLWLSSAFVLGNVVPVVGKPIGDLMTRLCAKYFAHSPSFSADHGSHVNYPYFYFYKGLFLGGSGGTNYLKHYSPQRPTFYSYGAAKPFMFHSDGWLKEMDRREDCQVQAFPCGHWVQVDQGEALNHAILKFITTHSA